MPYKPLTAPCIHLIRVTLLAMYCIIFRMMLIVLCVHCDSGGFLRVGGMKTAVSPNNPHKECPTLHTHVYATTLAGTLLHTHTHTYIYIYIYTQSLSLSFSLSLSHTHALSLTLSLFLSLTHTHALSLTFAHSLYTHSYSHRNTHTLHTLIPMLTHTHACSLSPQAWQALDEIVAKPAVPDPTPQRLESSLEKPSPPIPPRTRFVCSMRLGLCHRNAENCTRTRTRPSRPGRGRRGAA
jgi:hypothetical protein